MSDTTCEVVKSEGLNTILHDILSFSDSNISSDFVENICPDKIELSNTCFTVMNTSATDNIKQFADDGLPKYKVGQIIFDMNGEYANANLQDEGTAIFEKYSEITTRYSVLDKTGFKVLKVNFFKETTVGFELICSLLSDESGDYIKSFIAVDLEKPSDMYKSAYTRWARKSAVYQCCLKAAGFTVPQNHKVKFVGNKDINNKIVQERIIDPNLGIDLDDATAFWTWVAENQDDQFFVDYRSKNGHDWVDEDLKALLVFLTRRRNLSGASSLTGYRKLVPLKDYHTIQSDLQRKEFDNMSYGNDYSNKPFERASKTSHTNIINDTEVQSFLSKCKIPPYHEDINDKDIELHILESLDKNPINNIITIDGGYTNVSIKENFPSSTIAFFQFGALFFKHKDLLDLKEKPFIDPDDFSRLQNIQRIKLVIPTKGIALDGEIDFISSARRTIYDFFVSQPEKNGLIDALKWLIFEEYQSTNKDIVWHLATCPHCNKGVDIQKKDVLKDHTITYPHCGEKIYLTDVLRLHEVIDNELGAGGILGYLTTSIEQIIIVFLIKQMLSLKPSLLTHTLFVKDGPLAFFGQTANLHKPMRKLLTFLNENYAIYLVGLEKSGSFVEHAEQVSKKMLPKQILLLGNKYIYKYIIPGYDKNNEPYNILNGVTSKLLVH